MVLTNVKINKESEDKQKALYLAQQVIEKQKLDSNIEIGTTTSEAIDFKVQKTVTELGDYKFPDIITSSEVSSDKPKTFVDLDKIDDVKIEINASTNEKPIKVTYYNEYGQKQEKEFKLKEALNVLNITNYNGYMIVNINKEDAFKIEDDPDKIICKKINSDVDKETGDVIVQCNTDNQPKVEIRGLNNCDKDLNFYFATSKEQGTNYSLINDGGKIRSYYNIFYADSEHRYKNNSRVYRIDVEISKNGKSLQKITAFKTAVE